LGWGEKLSNHRRGAHVRPSSPEFQGQLYVDTTIDATVIWGGPVSGWLHYITGAQS
jgi:hypothetical protein